MSNLDRGGGGWGKPSSYPYLKKNPKKPTQIRVNLQYKFKVYCREYGQYLIQFDAHEISAMGLEVRAFKNSNKWTPAFKDYWRWKSLYFEEWINAHTPIEKQSNQN